MSAWTYVFGSIQGEVSPSETRETLKEVLGEIREWGDAMSGKITEEQWHDAFDKEKNPIPMGSEGSVRYSLSFMQDKMRGKVAYISFYGALRDYGGEEEDIDGIRRWFISIFDRIYLPNAYLRITTPCKVLSYETYDCDYSLYSKSNGKAYRFIEHEMPYRAVWLEKDRIPASRIVKITGKGKVRNAEMDQSKKKSANRKLG